MRQSNQGSSSRRRVFPDYLKGEVKVGGRLGGAVMTVDQIKRLAHQSGRSTNCGPATVLDFLTGHTRPPVNERSGCAHSGLMAMCLAASGFGVRRHRRVATVKSGKISFKECAPFRC